MISFIIIVTILIFNAIIIYILKRNNISVSNSSWLLLICVLIIFIGLALIIWQDDQIILELDKRNWLITTGEIIQAEIVGERAV